MQITIEAVKVNHDIYVTSPDGIRHSVVQAGGLLLLAVSQKVSRQLFRYRKQTHGFGFTDVGIPKAYLNAFVDEFVPQNKRAKIRKGKKVRFWMPFYEFARYVGIDFGESG